ncbi:MAG: hypothetical protein ACRD3Q_03515 [Terriglobales bacterium]
MTTDERDYREKNQWRRWVWNRIAERLTHPAYQSTAIYLAGVSNLDRPEAIRRGFQTKHLIAVDANPNKVTAIRARGELCICGDILDIAFNYGCRVDALHLDFCCGLELGVLQKIGMAMAHPDMRACVFSLNFLRGRDPSSAALRESIAGNGRCPDVLSKHRGYLALHALTAVTFLDVFRGASAAFKGYAETLINDAANAEAYSYRSSTHQTFDTVVFTNPLGAFLDSDDYGHELRAVLRTVYGSRKIRSRIAAHKANATRRSALQ